ncbi:D-isomer specific 2-hydroxyacid dehydrogenase family protein [Actinidia rufa]|uniref:D-isomer specific 2-hydroxyacid dehydrogenase family protein n=1 Tax=Actinidia rufa TaxID=165716 RepID=A0A7J0FLL9_9ERIC|nr:D-isomer specific 2-hydroxyacid dehydrogenase family protein [Actinidia rufa]
MENQVVAAKLLPKVLILEPPSVFTAFETEFSQKFECLRAWESPIPTEEFLDAHARSVEAMLVSGFTPITSAVLHRVPSLRCIVTTSVGLDHMDLQECRRREIAVANAGNVFSEDVADLAVALLIDVLRRITAADRFVRGEIWPIKGEYPLGSKVKGLNSLSIFMLL